ncbi:hypothetical protein ACFFGT_20395 [Mucilaginibacter angelicae]|uniref:Uncharacterized protein n=1 Tax=Mucilaginibacter angelicae TaxID=869718 RepID=A0ABV6LAW5_9SPHI
MSNEEIIEHISINDNVCGRFEKQQLDKPASYLFDKYNRQHLRKYVLMAVSIISFVQFAGAKARLSLLQQVDSLHKKHQTRHPGISAPGLNRRILHLAGYKANGKISTKGKPVKLNSDTRLPADTLFMGKAVVNIPEVKIGHLKNLTVIRSVDTVANVIGGVVTKGIVVKKEEKEIDRSMLYEFGIR